MVTRLDGRRAVQYAKKKTINSLALSILAQTTFCTYLHRSNVGPRPLTACYSEVSSFLVPLGISVLFLCHSVGRCGCIVNNGHAK